LAAADVHAGWSPVYPPSVAVVDDEAVLEDHPVFVEAPTDSEEIDGTIMI
jgi:hypothetical protein